MKKLFIYLLIGLFLINLASAVVWDNIAYWNLNETSGIVIDSTGNYNATSVNAVRGQTGILGNAYNFSANQYVNLSNKSISTFKMNDSKDDFSVSLWVYGVKRTDFARVFIGSKGELFDIMQNTTGHIRVDFPITESSSTQFYSNAQILDNQWVHLVLTHNSTINNLYINGTLVATQASTPIVSFIDGLIIGNDYNFPANYYSGGKVDEVGIWGRTLIPAEIGQLYNSGNGLNYGEISSELSVTLNSPENNNPNYETDDLNLLRQFNFTARARFSPTQFNLTNVSLWTNGTGTWTITNTTNLTGLGIANYTSVFNYTIPANSGIIWNVQACDNSGNCTFAYLNRTIVNTPIFFTICNSTYSTPFLNITFKDESTLNNINASITSSTFEYYIGSGQYTKTYTYSNSTDNFNYTFCFSNPTSNINVNPYVQYKQGTAYPQRIWDVIVQAYTNITTNQTLYLLGSGDGIYVTFQVVNPSNQVISDVSVNATRSISGTDVLVGQGSTDAAGTITFWLNPDYSHTLVFSKSGFETQILTIIPTQSSYTVTMGGGTAAQIIDYTKGITLNIQPSIGETLYNDTIYKFNMTIITSYWDLEGFGITLKLSNGTILSSTSSTSSSGGVININLNTTDYKRIVMDYYWTINGTNSTRTAYWNVISAANNEFSIFYFFTDLEAFLDTDMFGIDEFGRLIMVYLIVFISIGVMSYKYGLASPMSIMTMIFGIIYFFDVALGFLPNPISAIPNFFTWLAGLIVIVFVLKEVTT